MKRSIRRRFGPARGGAQKDPPVYLSVSEGRYRVISHGLPISADKTSARDALAVATHFGLKVSDRVWYGDKGEWGTPHFSSR